MTYVSLIATKKSAHAVDNFLLLGEKRANAWPVKEDIV